jgi:hypothetical protein
MEIGIDWTPAPPSFEDVTVTVSTAARDVVAWARRREFSGISFKDVD